MNFNYDRIALKIRVCGPLNSSKHHKGASLLYLKITAIRWYPTSTTCTTALSHKVAEFVSNIESGNIRPPGHLYEGP